MSCNTTEHLLADMERLREHLSIDRWLLFSAIERKRVESSKAPGSRCSMSVALSKRTLMPLIGDG